MSGSATEPSPPPCVLVIGYGNSLRRDDGAGLFLATALAERWLAAGQAVRHLAVQQLVPELAEEIAAPAVTSVLFVDTRSVDATSVDTASANGDVGLPMAELARVKPLPSSPSSGHHLEPAVLLLYAERLWGRCPPAWLLTVTGSDFGFGEGFSPGALAGIGDSLRRAPEIWDTISAKHVK